MRTPEVTIRAKKCDGASEEEHSNAGQREPVVAQTSGIIPRACADTLRSAELVAIRNARQPIVGPQQAKCTA